MEVRIPRPLPTLRCDRVGTRALLQNLLSNAAKYRRDDHPAGERPQVQVTWREPDDGGPIEVSVADNGIGIKPRYHDRIFQIIKRFYAAIRPKLPAT